MGGGGGGGGGLTLYRPGHPKVFLWQINLVNVHSDFLFCYETDAT